MKKNNRFASKWGFVLACAGSAVGMANVWGFPYKVGSSGGGAFLLIYLFFIILFGYVGLSAEYAIGRLSGTGTLGLVLRVRLFCMPMLGNTAIVIWKKLVKFSVGCRLSAR